MEALHDVVKAGKARYIGASSMYAWQFAKAQSVAKTRFVSMQNHYNLVYREEEREMIPQCIDQGVAISLEPARTRSARRQPDARGREADDSRQDRRVRRQPLHAGRRLRRRRPRGRGRCRTPRPTAQVALAWLLHKPGVTAPIVGATKVEHLEDAIAAEQLSLSAEEIERLEEPYVPHAISGQLSRREQARFGTLRSMSPDTDTVALLQRYRPVIQYDSQESFYADSAAIITDLVVPGSPNSNCLKTSTGKVLAARASRRPARRS